jgi:hypothetical protein
MDHKFCCSNRLPKWALLPFFPISASTFREHWSTTVFTPCPQNQKRGLQQLAEVELKQQVART